MEFEKLRNKVGLAKAVIFSCRKLSPDFWKGLHIQGLVSICEEAECLSLWEIRDFILSKIDELELIKDFYQWLEVYDLACGDNFSVHILKQKALGKMAEFAKDLDQQLVVFNEAPRKGEIQKDMLKKISDSIIVE